ncbi:MAG: nucleotide-binding protein [Nitrosopumilus sp.]|nr:nucleotide-binding protein [Nitrosopumilus sp.]
MLQNRPETTLKELKRIQTNFEKINIKNFQRERVWRELNDIESTLDKILNLGDDDYETQEPIQFRYPPYQSAQYPSTGNSIKDDYDYETQKENNQRDFISRKSQVLGDELQNYIHKFEMICNNEAIKLEEDTKYSTNIAKGGGLKNKMSEHTEKDAKDLEDLIMSIERFAKIGHAGDPNFKAWKAMIQRTIAKIFGSDSMQLSDIKKIHFEPSKNNLLKAPNKNKLRKERLQNGLRETEYTLKSFLTELSEIPPKTNPPLESKNRNKKDVFIVHGHDEEAKLKVKDFVRKMELNPIILHEQANIGRTVIEKFEDHAEKAGFAIVILTPDDSGHSKGYPNEIQDRARQNVIFELGFFHGRLGRGKVCALYKKGVEIPSDIKGVLFTRFDESNDWQMNLLREMKHSGLDVDLNKLLQ